MVRPRKLLGLTELELKRTRFDRTAIALGSQVPHVGAVIDAGRAGTGRQDPLKQPAAATANLKTPFPVQSADRV